MASWNIKISGDQMSAQTMDIFCESSYHQGQSMHDGWLSTLYRHRASIRAQ